MKKTLISVFLISLLTIITFFSFNDRQPVKKYIFDHNSDISLTDVKDVSLPFAEEKLAFEKAADNNADVKIKADTNTLKFLKSLEQLFPESKTVEEHLEAVKNRLLAKYPHEKAEALYQLYSDYLNCEIALSKEIDSESMKAGNADDVLETLAEIQDFRRENLGKATADALFGPTIKRTEYNIRKTAILNNDVLYGAEKEDAMAELNEDMWGNESGNVNQNVSAYRQYQEKVKLYKKDLGEASTKEEARELVKQFREEFFHPETIEKLEALEREKNQQTLLEASYYKKAAEFDNSQHLSTEEKEEMLRELQNDLFGENAENFRARLRLKLQ